MPQSMTGSSPAPLDGEAAGSLVRVSLHERLSKIEEQLSNERALRLEAEQRLYQRVSDLVRSVVLQQLQKVGIVPFPKVGLHAPTGTLKFDEGAARHADAPQPAHSIDVLLATVQDTTKTLGRRLEDSQRRVEMVEQFVRQRFAEYPEQLRDGSEAKGSVRAQPDDRNSVSETGNAGVRDASAPTESTGTGDASQPWKALRTASFPRAVGNDAINHVGDVSPAQSHVGDAINHVVLPRGHTQIGNGGAAQPLREKRHTVGHLATGSGVDSVTPARPPALPTDAARPLFLQKLDGRSASIPTRLGRQRIFPRAEGNCERGAHIATKLGVTRPRHALAQLGSALAACERERLSRIESVSSYGSEPVL